MKLVENAVGRLIPEEINGRSLEPFRGIYEDVGGGYKAAPPIPACSGIVDKTLSLEGAIEGCELRDGMCISFHHHLRNGDKVVEQIMRKLAEMGLEDLVLAPSALFPCHEFLVEMLEKGVIRRIEGSMNGPVGRACSQGKMRDVAVLRSHGGRVRAIQDGDLHIDVAFIGASAADRFGNANGVLGKSAFGPMAFSVVDSLYADKVVIVTDNIVDFPCIPFSIQGGNVNFVVRVDSIGDPSGILSGTTRITRSPTRLLIAKYAALFIKEAGLLGAPFQAGAGEISLAVTKFLGDMLETEARKAPFVIAGSTEYTVDLLEKGLVGYILDGQSFDPAAIASLRDNPRHIEITIDQIYNYHAKGCFVEEVGAACLGGTEVDLDFNVNVNTHSDGLLLHGIGGFQDAAYAGLTLVAVPTFRGRVPIIKEKVTTVTAPGELIDVIVTERGIAINPQREDLVEKFKRSSLPIVSLEKLKTMAEEICGKPLEPQFTDRIVALIEFRDGTVIDVVREVQEEG